MAVATRLVSQNGDVKQAAKRLVDAARGHGIDLTLVWAVFESAGAGGREPGSGPVVRQCCLMVPGAGRTVMAFVSEPSKQGEGPLWEATGVRERAACVAAAVSEFAMLRPGVAAVAQSLPSPDDRWAVQALQAAGFGSVGELDYLRLEPATKVERAGVEERPRWALRPLSDVPAGKRRAILLDMLGRSYEETMDCPELCGVRTTEDILDSHFATGTFDAGLWWIVTESGAEDGVKRDVGCVLMSACPEQNVVELVYLGLALSVRGRGWSKGLLSVAVCRVRERYRSWPITCAVDRRNESALRLYRGLGFRAFARRLALVRALPTA